MFFRCDPTHPNLEPAPFDQGETCHVRGSPPWQKGLRYQRETGRDQLPIDLLLAHPALREHQPP